MHFVYVLSPQMQQSLREKLSSESEKTARLKDDLETARRRQTSTDEELTNLRTIMHGADNELLAKTMSLDQALRVRFVAILLPRRNRIITRTLQLIA